MHSTLTLVLFCHVNWNLLNRFPPLSVQKNVNSPVSILVRLIEIVYSSPFSKISGAFSPEESVIASVVGTQFSLSGASTETVPLACEFVDHYHMIGLLESTVH